MPARVSTGDRYAVLRQIRWCAAVQSLVNCHRQLEENPVGNVEPMPMCISMATIIPVIGVLGLGLAPKSLLP